MPGLSRQIRPKATPNNGKAIAKTITPPRLMFPLMILRIVGSPETSHVTNPAIVSHRSMPIQRHCMGLLAITGVPEVMEHRRDVRHMRGVDEPARLTSRRSRRRT